jgi:hypothetical protein
LWPGPIDTFGRMVGKGRLRALGVHSADPVLSLLAALGLGQSVGTALVVELVGDVRPGTARTLADLAEAGPALDELSPGRPGVALMSGGGVDFDAAVSLVTLFARHWPAVVIRHEPSGWDGPSAPVVGLLPGLLRVEHPGPAVWQPTGTERRPLGPGPVLPLLRPRLVRSLLGGQMASRARWVQSWAPIWEMPWG